MVVSIGVQSFQKIRETGAFYVDKTDFIKQWWELNIFEFCFGEKRK